jgi:hypothetical protein
MITMRWECGDELEHEDDLEDDDLAVREDGMQHLKNVIKPFNAKVDMVIHVSELA